MRECLKVDRELTSEKCRFIPCATRHVALPKIKDDGKVKWYCLL